ncbi:GntR family transcriptional regulator [Pusillimonas sp. TS35]|nr:GntR family transcriptional regulator [Pusillimonas sp. TS35]
MTKNALPEVFAKLHKEDYSGVPKYRLVLNAITEGIKSGHWKPGERLPTEEELVQMIPYSLGTVQRALRLLVDQGIVVRQHGLGSFVAKQSLQIKNPWHCRFIADDGHSFVPVYSKILGRDAAREPGRWSSYLGTGVDTTVLVERVININHEFDVYSKFYFDRRVLPRLWEVSLDRLNGLNFRAHILGELNMPITHVDHYVTQVPIEKDIAGHINVKPATVGMRLDVLAGMGRDTPVYYQELYIPPTDRTLALPGQMLD